MKKILIAMDNQKMLEQLKKTGKYILYDQDIVYKEGVIEYLAKNEIDVIITRDNLQGEMTKEIYVKQLRMVSPKIRIILFVKEIEELYKGFLLANDVMHIIEKEEIGFSNLLELIESREKHLILNNVQSIENSMEKTNKLNIFTRQLISVFGTSGSGKSYVASLLGQLISRKLSLNTLLIDMDTINSSIDIYNNLNNNENTLNYVMEEIDQALFSPTSLQRVVTRIKKNNKLAFVTNNLGMYECQNKLSEKYYNELYKAAESKYDITLIDLPSSPFLDVVPFSLKKSHKIIFVMNPNFISIRQSLKHLDLLVNLWKINKQDIHIIINKNKKDSLGIRQIKSMLSGYTICLVVENNDSVEGIINGTQELTVSGIRDYENLLQLLGIEGNDRRGSIVTKINGLFGVKV